MENASKALTMAGGVLLAIMVVGALILMFNKISDYQKSNTGAQKESQIALFNQDFLKYFDEKNVKGTDIISLVNKVIDFNAKDGSGNYVDYEKEITLHLDLTGFAQKYGVGNKSKLFGNIFLHEIMYSNHSFAKKIAEFSALEKKYTLVTMGKLKSNYSSLKSGEKTIQQVTGKTIEEIEDIGDTDDIAEYLATYIEYTEFKSSSFEAVGTPVYDEGQVVELSFKFVQ